MASVFEQGNTLSQMYRSSHPEVCSAQFVEEAATTWMFHCSIMSTASQ